MSFPGLAANSSFVGGEARQLHVQLPPALLPTTRGQIIKVRIVGVAHYTQGLYRFLNTNSLALMHPFPHLLMAVFILSSSDPPRGHLCL